MSKSYVSSGLSCLGRKGLEADETEARWAVDCDLEVAVEAERVCDAAGLLESAAVPGVAAAERCLFRSAGGQQVSSSEWVFKAGSALLETC